MRSTNTLALSNAIRQLDKIAAEVQIKQFDALESEDAVLTTLRLANASSANLLLAIHHCRMGYLLKEHDKWEAALKRFNAGIGLLITIPLQQLNHEHIIFFSQAAFMLSRILILKVDDTEKEIHAINTARHLILHLSQENRTDEDIAYLLLYTFQITRAECRVDKSSFEELFAALTDSDVMDKRIENLKLFLKNVLPRGRKLLSVDLNVDSIDEANKAGKLFFTAVDGIPGLKQSALEEHSIFRIAPHNVAEAEHKTTLSYELR